MSKPECRLSQILSFNSAAQWSYFLVPDAFLKSCGRNRRNLHNIILLVLLNAEVTHIRGDKHLLDIASTLLPNSDYILTTSLYLTAVSQ